MRGISETELGHRPMPSNARGLYRLCLAEAKHHVGELDVTRDRDVKWARRAWAEMALAAAISCKHASAVLRRNRNHAAMTRVHYARLAESARLFGDTLVPRWGRESEAA